jgi:flavin reductase (DIM6/NTAB) family NADH-FMN oxidoreductase RutF
MLAVGQEEVSRAFATKWPSEEKFAQVDYRLENRVPVLNGCLAWLVCSLESEFRRGDHVVAIGEVVAGESSAERAPLLYYRSSYLTLPAPGASPGEPPPQPSGARSGGA